MKRVILFVYVALVVVLAVTTFVGQARGTAFAGAHVYHAVWFALLWGVLAVLTLVACVRMRLWRRVPLLLLHGSFLVILGGALITFLWGEQGYVHLEEGRETDRFVARDGGQLLPLPFSLRLDSFRVQCYPGTDAPEDYISHVRLSGRQGEGTRTATVSMNLILMHEGYRFYQSSYDPDGRGSWLSVNHDPWGIGVTYAGYALLGLSMLWVLCSRGGEFRRLLRHPLLRMGGFLVLFLGWGTDTPVQAQGRKLPVLKQRQADSLAAVQVIYQDRVVPFNTLARDFVLKLTGRPTYRGLTPEQVVGGWLLHPEVWKDEPMIRIKSAALRRRLALEGEYARLSDLFEGDRYRLQEYWDASAGHTDRGSPLDKAIVETDEKVGLILMLQQGTLIRPLPDDGSVARLPEAKVRAELLYNRIPFSRWLFMFNLSVGLLAFALLLYKGLRPVAADGRMLRGVERFFACALWAALLFQALGYGLRWYIGGRIPLSNGYETMQFLALATLLLACLLRRRFPFTLPFGFLLSGFALLVSYLGQMDPQITPLMPVLVSPWLSSHVSLIMMSYALFAFLMLNGVLALCVRREALRLMLLSRLLLYPAVFFLGAGIFLGAIWANVSWGHYWSWDPKEVWALVTFMVYAVPFHAGSLPRLRKPLFFHVYMMVAFLTVLMTYFGVNYVLGGMHSYAG